MIKKLVASAALLMAVACTSMTPSSETGTAGAPAVATRVKSAPNDILLSAPGAARDWDVIMPEQGLHVRGTMTNRGFQPVGEIQGRGRFCADGKDWLSLSDLKLHKAGEGTPVAPYILGCVSGYSFTPASREIVTQ
jgi:hypothetical protein